MPDRRHIWRGVHDAEMVKSGVRILLKTSRPRYKPGEDVEATLSITNSGVGHYFPTYVTPRVLMRVELRAASGESLTSTVRERVIARQVPLDLSREISDTRIPPGGEVAMKYRQRLDRSGLTLRATVTVFPDYFYTGFFQAILENGAGAGEPQIREALEATRRSPFVIFSREVPVS